MEKAPLARSVFVFECVSVSGRPVFREAVCAPREGGETVVLTSALHTVYPCSVPEGLGWPQNARTSSDRRGQTKAIYRWASLYAPEMGAGRWRLQQQLA